MSVFTITSKRWWVIVLLRVLVIIVNQLIRYTSATIRTADQLSINFLQNIYMNAEILKQYLQD